MRSIRTLFTAGALSLFPLVTNAVSVELFQTAADHCMIDPGHAPNGALLAVASGGTGPYRYDWYDVSFGMVELCTDCGAERQGLTGYNIYKVVVTDALSATAEATLGVEAIAGVELWEVQNLAYEMGTAPVLTLSIRNDPPDAEDIAPQVQITPEPLFIQGPWPGWETTVKAVMPVGTTSANVVVEHWGEYYCITQETYTISAPTVLPGIELVTVEGSCSTAGTGSAVLRYSGGVLSSSLFAVVKDEAGQPISSIPVVGIGPQPYLHTVTGLGPGNYWLVVTGDGQVSPVTIAGFTYTCRDSIPFTIPSLGPTCGQVNGTAYLDINANCGRQGNEQGVPATVLEVLPGPRYTTTNSTGLYELVLPNGNYTIREQSTLVNEHCSQTPIPFTVNGGVVTVDQPSISTMPLDLSVSLASGAARPGFEFRYALNGANRTVTSSGTVTVSLQLDPDLLYQGATPPPTSISGGLLTWSLLALSVFQQRDITVRTQVPADVALLGTDLVSTATISSAVSDGDLSNNVSSNTRLVTGSYDPNDKLAYTSSGSTTHYEPSQDQWIDYTIRFQNTGTDTAFHILITDTLAANLDPSSLIMGAASHTFSWELRGAGILKFRFYNILLPDSNVNEPRSHGFVSFRIKPRTPLSAGTQIINRANIYFDFNPPVITDPSVLTVPTPPVLVSPRVFLGGNYSASTPPMTDALRLLNKVPRVEPYSDLGYVHQGTGGGETATPASFLVSGNDAVVDWVVVELRGTSGAGSVVASRAALLQRDGDVVGPNGTSPVAFHVPSGGSYRIAVRHRNHLGVMTSTARTLTTTTTVVDFTLAATATYGTNARNTVGGSMVLWPGDTNGDGLAKYTGSFNDRDIVLQGIGGTVPTNTVNNVYDNRDVNLNGNIMYTGTGNDRDVILQAIGGTVPTAVRTQQLP